MLSQKKCIPCKGGVPLSPTHIEDLLPEVPGWEFVVLDRDASPAIRRRYDFKDFSEALAFVNKVSAIAEAEGHHPDIAFGWGYAEITLYTHTTHGLHENDFIMAAKINELCQARAT